MLRDLLVVFHLLPPEDNRQVKKKVILPISLKHLKHRIAEDIARNRSAVEKM